MLVLLLHYCLFIVALLFLLFFTIECNPAIGSHTGGLLGSLQASMQVHLSAATNIVAVAKANAGGTAERNHHSNVVEISQLSCSLCLILTSVVIVVVVVSRKTKRTNKIPMTMTMMTTTMSLYMCKEKRIQTGTVWWQLVLDYFLKKETMREEELCQKL